MAEQVSTKQPVFQNEIALATSSSPVPIVPLIDSSTQTELSPSFFKFNPLTDPSQPDLVENQGSSSTNNNGYLPDQNSTIKIPLDAQGTSQDFNFDLAINTNDSPMEYMPMTDLVLPTPTIESLELSIQILWAEHQMRTQYLGQ